MTPDQSTRNAREDFPTLRQSTLSDFDQCALMAAFGREYRSGWSSHPQARGHLFHMFAAKALAELHNQSEKQMEPDVGHAILNEVLRQQDVAPEEVVNIPMSEIRDLHWVVTKWCHDNVWDIENLAEVEKRLYADLYIDGVDKRTLTGQIDALFFEGDKSEHAIVVDWKDTWAMPGPSELDEGGYFQQRFYAWLVFRNYKSVESMTLREFYVRYSEPREATVWRDDVDNIEQELAAMVVRFDRTYEEEVYPPSPGKHCQYCPRPSACPIEDFNKDEGAVRDPEMAQRMAARLIKADAIAKKAKKALQGYASVHGPVPVKAAKGRAVWGFQESERTSRPTRDELDAALRTGNVDLDLLYKTSKSSRFSQHSPKDSPTDDANGEELLDQLERSLRETKQSDSKGTVAS